MLKQFQDNENDLLETFFNATFHKFQKSPFLKSDVFQTLEMIVTPQCNQRCEYCYITKYGDSLYPQHIRADHDTTLSNMKKLMDYLTYEKHYYFIEYELFAGDLYTTNLLVDSLNLMIPYFEYIKDKAPEIFQYDEIRLVIPTNLQFVMDEEFTNEIIALHNRLESIGVNVNWSWSHDGKYSANTREKKELTDEFYEKAFTFCHKTNAGIHPMLSAQDADKAISNFDWWVEMYAKYLPERVENGECYPRYLEVRNGDEWTDDNIEHYLGYLKHRLEYVYSICNDDTEAVAKYLFRAPDAEKKNFEDYDAFDVITSNTNDTSVMSCIMQKSIIVRISDLAIVPCHRLTYDMFIGGWFTVEDEKIVGFKANNVTQLIDTKMHRIDLDPICATCWNRSSCIHGCLGAQYEWSGELYLPIASVCKMQKAKTSFILKMFCDTCIMSYAMQFKHLDSKHKDNLKKLCERLGYSYGATITNTI